jgi:hypothetical protein
MPFRGLWRAAIALHFVRFFGGMGGGFVLPLGCLCDRGKRPKGLRLILQSDMGVPHRHSDIPVTGKLPGMSERHTAVDEARNMGVATGRVEIGDPFFCLVGDACCFQVLLDHTPGLLPFQFWKKRFVRPKRREPFTEKIQKVRMDRERVLLAVFGTGCFHGQSRRIAVELETRGGEAP